PSPCREIPSQLPSVASTPSLRLVLLVDRAYGVGVAEVDQQPVPETARTIVEWAVPRVPAGDDLGELRDRDARSADAPRRLLRDPRGPRVRGHVEGEQAVALVDDVVVVGDLLVLLGRRAVGRQSAEPPGRVEAELEVATLPLQRMDVAPPGLLTGGGRAGKLSERAGLLSCRDPRRARADGEDRDGGQHAERTPYCASSLGPLLRSSIRACASSCTDCLRAATSTSAGGGAAGGGAGSAVVERDSSSR